MIVSADRDRGGHRGNYGNFGEEEGRDWGNRGGRGAPAGGFGGGVGGGRPRPDRRHDDLPNPAPGNLFCFFNF